MVFIVKSFMYAQNVVIYVLKKNIEDASPVGAGLFSYMNLILKKSSFMKVCSKCKIEKDESLFSKRKANSDGLCSSCKECDSLYYLLNKDRYLQKGYQNSTLRNLQGSC